MDGRKTPRAFPIFAAVLIATACTALPTQAQDMFGRAVTIVDDAVLVVKPLVGVGSATVYVFEQDRGEWHVAERLRASGGSVRGEGFSSSMVWSGTDLFVASGDPELRWAAHEFGPQSGQGWGGSTVIPIRPEVVAEASSGPPEVTLGTVMGILQPPERVVAAEGNRISVAIMGSPAAEAPPVRVLRRDPSGSWATEAVLRPDEITTGARFGSAMAMSGGVLAIGSPGLPGRGGVWVYTMNEAGQWALDETLRAETLPDGVRFGSAVAFAGERLLVGAPGTPEHAGMVVAYQRDATGAWLEHTRLETSESFAGDRLGSTIGATATEVWVGAPGANDQRGAVARFALNEAGSSFSGWVQTSGLEPGYQFGTALHLVDDMAVVGAPNALGATGAAAAYTRDASGSWSGPSWLESDEQLDLVTGGQVDCSEDGDAAGFDCDDVDLLAFLPLSAFGAEPGERVSDIWGWTDPQTGREYTLVGRTAGMAIVDVTDAQNPVYVGLVRANPSGARDIKVYQDYAFFTGDGAGEHGLVVFDLKHLRDVDSPPQEFSQDARYDGIASAHNLVLDPEAGFAYPVGASGGGETCGGGLHMVDVRDPLNPTFAGCFTDTEGLIWEGRTHDAQCTVYRGPDTQYRGREICFVSNETALRIVDVTDKSQPVPLGSASYPGVAYIHQGWLTEDQRHFYLNDELDELVGTSERTRTLIWDVSELDDPVLASNYYGPNGATDHNLYVKGDRMYQANYQAGFRVLDISDPEAPVEVGYFDTTPYEGDPPGFVGAWTAFPYFDSGTVVVSSMHEGLFLLKPRRRDLIP